MIFTEFKNTLTRHEIDTAETITKGSLVSLNYTSYKLKAGISNDSNIIGIAQESGVAGDFIYVATAGIAEGASGLIVGETCWSNINGVLFTNSIAVANGADYFVGVCTSTTEVRIDMKTFSEAIDNNQIDSFGEIDGGIEFQSTSTPPIILSGYYDVSGTKVKVLSDYNLTLNDTFQQCKNTLDTFIHYLVCMNSTGDTKYILYGEGAVSNGTITSITSVGTTYTLTVATGTVGSYANKVLVIEGNDNINGTFKITGGNGTTTYTFTTQAGFTNGGASGTWRVLERIKTLHGAGTLASITTNANVIQYSPSLAENTSESIAAFSQTKNGYYLTLSGLTDYRVLGSFFTDTTPNVSNKVFSYKSGRNKNDNIWNLQRAASNVTNAIRWTTINYMYGCDYVFVDSAGVGSELTAQRNLSFTSSFTAIGTVSYYLHIAVLNLSVNTMLNTNSETVTHNANNLTYSAVSNSRQIFKNQILKVFCNSISTANDQIKFIGSFSI